MGKVIMKASELLKILENNIEEYGDTEINILIFANNWNPLGCNIETSIKDVIFSSTNKHYIELILSKENIHELMSKSIEMNNV